MRIQFKRRKEEKTYGKEEQTSTMSFGGSQMIKLVGTGEAKDKKTSIVPVNREPRLRKIKHERLINGLKEIARP